MVASPPEQWYDVRQFLVQGGYYPLLDQRHLRNQPWLPIAAEMMQSMQSHLDWLRQWRFVALNEKEQGYCSDPLSESKVIHMFFETAQYAYHGNFRDALQVVNAFRKAHNFTTFLGMPPRSFQVNSSQYLANGITAETQGNDRYVVEYRGFDEANFTTAVNGMRSTIPSGLQILSDCSLSSPPDDDQNTPELLETFSSIHLDLHGVKASRLNTRVLPRSGEIESGIGFQRPVERVVSSNKRTCHNCHLSAVQSMVSDGFLEGPSSKRIRPSINPPAPTRLSVTPPMSQLTSQPDISDSGNTDIPQRTQGNTMDPQANTTSRSMVDLLNPSSDPLKMPAPSLSSSFETQVPSTLEPMDYDTTLDLSSSTRMPPELDHPGATLLHNSTLDSQCGFTSAYSERSQCHFNLGSITLEPALELQQPTFPLFWSPSPSERIDSDNTLVSDHLDLSDSIHADDGFNEPWLGAANFEYDPPWLALLEPPTPPNDARPPSIGDTQFWSLPSRFPMEHEFIPLILPDFPPRPPQTPVAYSTVHKPRLPMAPPVWAQSRQELCESLSYFRSYQGGVYSQKRRARGYLLDGHPAVQDLWHAEGTCIISHAGGNSAIDRVTGQTVLVDDQTVRSASCNALLSSWKFKQSVVLIAGNGYNLFPYDLGNRGYVVLGYYWITHAWEEPEPSAASPRGYFVRWKFVFQWIQSQGRPWWIPWDAQTDRLSDAEANLSLPRVCQKCFKHSRNIYNFGWVCTHSDCSLFSRRVDATALPLDASGFHPEFLTHRGDPSEFQGLTFQIRPKPPVQRKESRGKEHRQVTTSRHFWKGWCCDKCGRLSCREYWTHWECHNCHHMLWIKSRIQPPPAVIGKTLIHPSKASGICLEVRTLRDGPAGEVLKCQSFRLPWDRGVIHLLQAEKSAQTLADGIWHQYQQDAKQPGFFRRYSMKNHKLKGRMLSHYFSQNSGEPYEYVGGTDNTVPLGKYSSVSQAMALIRRQVSLVMGNAPAFNEILSAAYMAEQKMEFHSDGEKDLGPVIASLSLGSPATMRFRPIPSRWYSEESVEGVVRKSPPIVLTLTLRHGDVLIMEGAEIQEYYQHAVHPWGFRIAATARYIKSKGGQDSAGEGVGGKCT